MLEQIEEAIAKVHAQVAGSVVGIGHAWGAGSGVVVADGAVLTNAHNVRGQQVEVTFADGRTVVADVAGADVDRDLAVLEVPTDGTVPLIASTTEPSIGRAVFAVSNPAGRGVRVSLGFVSGVQRSFRGPRGRRISGAVEHTAPLLPGSSGGPLVDASGGLIGLNTNRLGEGYYLAIPTGADLSALIEPLRRGDVPMPKRLGVGIAPAEVARKLRGAVGLDPVDGLLVRHVEEKSPGAAAGLAVGDLIVSAGDRAIASIDDLHELLSESGDSVELTIHRGAEIKQVKVSFGG